MPEQRHGSDIDRLKAEVLATADLVDEQLELALQVLREDDTDLARIVGDGDPEVSRHRITIEGDCVELLAEERVSAGDSRPLVEGADREKLRRIVTAFAIATDLERIGEAAATLTRYGKQRELSAETRADLVALGERSRKRLADAMAAYAEDDVLRAVAIERSSGDPADDLVDRTVGGVVGGSSTGREVLVDEMIWTLLALRDLERIDGNAARIRERTVYAVTGMMPTSAR
ncbi:MAG: PhoU domain-containing protein [Halalkalicoccus sp.]